MALSWIVEPKQPQTKVEVAALFKARVAGYTRRDGTFVAPHDDKRPAKAAKPAKYTHPTVVGTAAPNHKDPAKADSMLYNGRHYSATGKAGKSLHDDTPVREFRELGKDDDDDESGHRVWMDHSARVHADSQHEVASLRKEHEKHGVDAVDLKDHIGAGIWREGHRVAMDVPGHHLHGKEGVVAGASTHEGHAKVKMDDGAVHSVPANHLKPAKKHSWPDAFGRQNKR